MNLLPDTEKNILKKGLKLRCFIMANILLSFSFIIGTIMLLPTYFLIEGHITLAASLDFAKKVEDQESINKILDLPKEIKSKLDFLQSNIKNRGAVDVLSKLVSFLPEKVKVDSISFVRNQGEKDKKGINIVLIGIASDRDALVSFGATLKTSKLFSVVDIPVSNLTKEKDLPFSVNIFIET